MSTVQKVMDATIVTGEYTNQAGEQKKEYLTVGALFIYNEGGMSLKIKDGITVSGNISFYDRKPKGQPQQNQNQGYQQQPQQQSQYQAPVQQQSYNQPQQNAQQMPHNQQQQSDADGSPIPF